MATWAPGSPAKFVMTVKLFMESPHITGDPKVLYMHYIQSVYNVITGIYPTSMDECVSLAALQLQAKFGDHNPAVYVRGVARVCLCVYLLLCGTSCRCPVQRVCCMSASAHWSGVGVGQEWVYVCCVYVCLLLVCLSACLSVCPRRESIMRASTVFPVSVPLL